MQRPSDSDNTEERLPASKNSTNGRPLNESDLEVTDINSPETIIPGTLLNDSSFTSGDDSLPYTILNTLKQGGMGSIYRARHERLNQIVALKTAHLHQSGENDEASRQRFRREIESIQKLGDHPNIITIHDCGRLSNSQDFYTMDFIDGKDMEELVTKKLHSSGESLSYRDQIAEWMIQVAEALKYAHANRVIHRDIKPSNILMKGGNQPILVDFGLAKNIEEESSVSYTGQVLGTPYYMSPEQARGEKEITAATDLYSLGATLYFLLTGTPPVRGENREQVLDWVINKAPVPPRSLNPSIPKSLETICLRLLAKDPRRRYDSCDKLIEDLKCFQQDRPLLWGKPVGAIEKIQLWRKRNWMVFSLLVTIAFILIVSVGSITWQWQAIQIRNEELVAALNDREVAQGWQWLRSRSPAAATQSAVKVLKDSPKNPGANQLLHAAFLEDSFWIQVAEKPLQSIQTTPTSSATTPEPQPEPEPLLPIPVEDFRNNLKWTHPNPESGPDDFLELTNHQGLPTLLKAEPSWKSQLLAADLSPDGSRALLLFDAPYYLLWDVEKNLEISRNFPQPAISSDRSFIIPGEWAFTTDGKALMFEEEGQTWFYDLQTGVRAEKPNWRWNFQEQEKPLLTIHHSRMVGMTDAPDSWRSELVDVMQGPTGIRINGLSSGASLALLQFANQRFELWNLKPLRSLISDLPPSMDLQQSAFSKDGKFLAIALDQEVLVWNIATGEAFGDPLNAGESITRIEFSPTGNSASDPDPDPDKVPELEIITYKTRQLWKLKPSFRDKDWVGNVEGGSAVFDPSGNFLASWSTSSGALLTQTVNMESIPLDPPPKRVTSLRFSPSGNSLAALDSDAVLIFETLTGKQIAKIESSEPDLNLLGFSSSGELASYQHSDKTFSVYSLHKDFRSDNPIWSQSNIRRFEWTPDGAGWTIVSEQSERTFAGTIFTLERWKASHSKTDQQLIGRWNALPEFWFNAAGDRTGVIVDGLLTIYASETGSRIAQTNLQALSASNGVEIFKGPLNQSVIIRQGKFVRAFSMADGAQLHDPILVTQSPLKVHFTEFGEWAFLIQGHDIWFIPVTPQAMKVLETPLKKIGSSRFEHVRCISGIPWDETPHGFAVLFLEHSIAIWDGKKYTDIPLKFLSDRVRPKDCAWSPDGSFLIIQLPNGKSVIWDLKWLLNPETVVDENAIRPVDKPLINPDYKANRQFAVVTYPATLEFYNIATLQLSRKIELDTPMRLELARFSPNGKYLTASAGREIFKLNTIQDSDTWSRQSAWLKRQPNHIQLIPSNEKQWALVVDRMEAHLIKHPTEVFEPASIPSQIQRWPQFASLAPLVEQESLSELLEIAEAFSRQNIEQELKMENGGKTELRIKPVLDWFESMY